jgi:hypothetical protein
MCDLIKKGVRVDLRFRVKYLKDVVEYVIKYRGRVVAQSKSTTILDTGEHVGLM